MIKLNAPKGLGDAIYLRAVVLHFLDKGEQVTVHTRWREVFADLPITIRTMDEIERHEDLRHVSYHSGRRSGDSLPALAMSGLSSFTLSCQNAGIMEPVDLRMNWKVRNPALLEQIKRKAAGREIFIYQSPRVIKNSDEQLMTPRREAFNKFIADNDQYFRIKLGHPPYVYHDPEAACELDLFGKAFIYDSFDVGTIGDLFFGQSCFICAMAEAMEKPYVCMFPRAAANSHTWHRYYMSPQRVIHKSHLGTVMYDDLPEQTHQPQRSWRDLSMEDRCNN